MAQAEGTGGEVSACGDREAAGWGCCASGTPDLSPPLKARAVEAVGAEETGS